MFTSNRGLSVHYFLLVVALALSSSLAAQDETPTAVTDQNRSGDLPFTTSIGSDIESVDAVSGTLKVRIPIASIKGRAGLDYSLVLRYDSDFWSTGLRVQNNTPYEIWNVERRNYIPAVTTGLGWEPNEARVSYVNSKVSCAGQRGSHNAYSGYILTDVDGAKHPLSLQTNYDCENGGIQDLVGPDITYEGMSSNIQNGVPSPVVTLANGTVFSLYGTLGCTTGPVIGCAPLLGAVKDSNGNSRTDGVAGVDTLGQTVVTQQNGTNQILYTVYDSSGTARTYTVNYGSITVQTNFHVTGSYGTLMYEYGPASRTVITSIVLPDGQSYTFQYENGTYGGLNRIGLPTGGYITYTWGTFVEADRTHRYVTSRTVNVGGQAYTWNVSQQCTSFGSLYCITAQSTVTDPLLNQTSYTSQYGAVTLAQIYQGSATGNPMRQYAIDYRSGDDPTNSELPGIPIRITTTVDNGQVSKKEFDYEWYNFNYHSCTNGGCDAWVGTTSRGNVVEIREYDWGAVPGAWGSGTFGPLIRRTDKTYLHNANSTYLTYNIVDKVLQDTVYDGASNTCLTLSQPCAQTQYEYDNYVSGSGPGTNPIVVTSGAPQHDYSNYPSTFIYRGNATRVKRWRNTDGALLTTMYQYDDLGSIRAKQDPSPYYYTTSWSYTDNWSGSACLPPSNSLAYPTQVTNALGQVATLEYFPCTGKLQSHTDPNNAVISHTYDLLGRQLCKNLPDTGQTCNSYNDVPPVSVTTTTKITGSMNEVSVAVEDGLGRVQETQLTSDPVGTVYVDTTYDALGRKATVSTPYRSTSEQTYGITTYNYDALGRVTLLIPPDGSSSSNHVSTVYAGPATTVTDQVGNRRKNQTDGLGRLTTVWEPDLSGALNYETDYQYDVLGDLTLVNQKGNDPNSADWRTRTFIYNSLSQLLTATNPESGTIQYTYDNDGNTATKMAPYGSSSTVTTTYSYDSLHRLLGKTYSNNDPSVTYCYDVVSTCGGLTQSYPKGRRLKMTDASGSTLWAYDSMGRALTQQGTIGTVTKNIGYTYNLAGSMTTLAYPSGRMLMYKYEAAGRPSTLRDLTNGINYVTGVTTGTTCSGEDGNGACYSPNGALATMVNGYTSSFAGITTTNSYDKRLQPVILSASAPSQTVFTLSFDFHLGTGDNGNLWGITNNRDSFRTLVGSATYTYDPLNRLQSAATTGTDCTVVNGFTKNWGESFTIDAWGNLKGITPNKCSAENLSVTVNGQNQINSSGYTYDAAGNMTADGQGHFPAYDGENRIKTIAGVNYTYDGDGKRVKKDSGKLYWTGTGSDPLDESDLSGNFTEEYVFFKGKRIARVDLPSGTVHYYFSDHLGSASVVTNATGTTIEQESDYYPYGGERVLTAGINNYKFTGKERDSESGLDMFGARYNASSLGRFMSPDPMIILPQKLVDPQQWNTYAYVRNNPLTFLDESGQFTPIWHDILTIQTLSALGYSPDVASAIAWENVKTDIYYNDEAHAYMHAQARRVSNDDGPGLRQQSTAEAKAEEQGFIAKSIGTAADDVWAGDFGAAQRALGQALHAAQDEKHNWTPFEQHTGNPANDLRNSVGREQEKTDYAPTAEQKATARRRTAEVIQQFERQVRYLGQLTDKSESETEERLHEFRYKLIAH